MIKHLETHNWEGALRGMRNPFQSHDKADSTFNPLWLGANDSKLFFSLIRRGASHRKFLRQIFISMDIIAPLKFFDEFATYEFTVSNSSSQMHLLGRRELREEDFSSVHTGILAIVNQKIRQFIWVKSNYDSSHSRYKEAWRDMVDNIPQSFLYTRTITMNYEVFLTMYHNRKNHKLEEWVDLCEELRAKLPLMNDIITMMEKRDEKIQNQK